MITEFPDGHGAEIQGPESRQKIIQRVGESFRDVLERDMAFQPPEIRLPWIGNTLADFANEIQNVHAEDMQARLQHVLDDHVFTPDGVFTFPDGNRWRCGVEPSHRGPR